MGNLTNNASNGNGTALPNSNADSTTVVLNKADLTALKGGKSPVIGDDLIMVLV